MPTDTIYGVVGSALSKKAVLRIYKLRRRNPKKPMIILIGAFKDLSRFGIRLDKEIKRKLNGFWPGRVSVILPCRLKKYAYLHRGTRTLAFRLPAKRDLRELLKFTGPLVAPSANIEGKRPARTIGEARKYFGGSVDFYIDAGKLDRAPSSLVKIEKSGIISLR